MIEGSICSVPVSLSYYGAGIERSYMDEENVQPARLPDLQHKHTRATSK